jgi:hypothetical protein
VLRRIYEAYAEHLKDPFYKTEMPIRSDKFDADIVAAIKS